MVAEASYFVQESINYAPVVWLQTGLPALLQFARLLKRYAHTRPTRDR